jgi:VanZ family protein
MALGSGLPSGAPKVSDITLHLFAFVYLTVALRIAHIKLAALVVCVLMLGYGGFIEIAQGFLPPRQSEWKDFGVDLLGIGLGLVLHHFLGEKVWRLFLKLLPGSPDKA